MKLPKDQPFLVSVVLHLIILIGFLIFTIVQAFWPKEKIHVFEVFDLPKEMSTSMETSLPMERPPNLPVADISEQIPTPQTLVSAEEFFKKNPRPEPKPRTAKKSVGIKVPQISVSEVVMKSIHRTILKCNLRVSRVRPYLLIMVVCELKLMQLGPSQSNLLA